MKWLITSVSLPLLQKKQPRDILVGPSISSAPSAPTTVFDRPQCMMLKTHASGAVHFLVHSFAIKKPHLASHQYGSYSCTSTNVWSTTTSAFDGQAMLRFCCNSGVVFKVDFKHHSLFPLSAATDC